MTMVFNRSKLKMLLAVSLVTSLSIQQAACSRSKTKNLRTSVTGHSPDEEKNSDGTAKTGDGTGPANSTMEEKFGLKNIQPKVGIKTFDQIAASYQQLTGVNTKGNATISKQFADLKGSLPTDYSLTAISPAMISAAQKLAAYYCDAMMADATLRSAAVAGFDFTKTPSVAFAGTGAETVAKGLIEKFWGKGRSDLPDAAETTKLVADLINDMKTGKADTAAMTLNLSMGACTAVLSSAPVLVY